jgi:transcriptional regulator with XRE-family HTH domain
MTGQELRDWRKRLNLTARQAAEKLGVSEDTYARLERRAEVDLRTALAASAVALGIKVDRL